MPSGVDTFDATNPADSWSGTVGSQVPILAAGSFPAGTAYTDAVLDANGQVTVSLTLAQIKGILFKEDPGAQSGISVLSTTATTVTFAADSGPAASGKAIRVVYTS